MKQLLTFLALLLVATLPAQDLDEGLVIHYPFEGNLTDSISGETSENFGNLTFGEGRVGTGAIRFFNNDAYFVTPAEKLQVGPAADGGTAGTFALFVNHRAGPLETDRQNYIAQKNGCGPDDNNRGRVVLYRQNPANATDPDSLLSFVTGAPLRTGYKLDSADTWIHLALTLDPETRLWAFYVDGVQTAQDTFRGMRQAENSCGEFVIGHHLTFDTETQTFDGFMDDLRFYNRVLSGAEIKLLAGVTTSTRENVVTDALNVYPNPVGPDGEVAVTFNRQTFRAGSTVRLNVIDVNGRSVLRRTYESIAERITFAQRLPAGVYTVTLTNGERLATAKLVAR